MKKLFKPIRLEWWQTALLKISMFSFGVFVGVAWEEFLIDWVNAFFILFLLPAIYLVYVWNKKDPR